MLKLLYFIVAAWSAAGASLAGLRQFLPVRRQGFTGH
jgi:hypothetical protein